MNMIRIAPEPTSISHSCGEEDEEEQPEGCYKIGELQSPSGWERYGGQALDSKANGLKSADIFHLFIYLCNGTGSSAIVAEDF
ncbi:uncharacterized protein G2W53_042283 [Senna tora]|uniref:Uncharacterized protein n=1 Tax=Senna tora TaxID=362788 RepID=A0A834SGR8_9FABA|nr:uncharacterized protein G2W53_042283 [Senna tora]